MQIIFRLRIRSGVIHKRSRLWALISDITLAPQIAEFTRARVEEITIYFLMGLDSSYKILNQREKWPNLYLLSQ